MHKLSNSIWGIKTLYRLWTFASDGLILPLNGTISRSALIIPIISSSSVNSSWWIPSKHFFRCGCTRSGSFVSERISNSSSFDKKKNLKTFSREIRCDLLICCFTLGRITSSFRGNRSSPFVFHPAGCCFVSKWWACFCIPSQLARECPVWCGFASPSTFYRLAWNFWPPLAFASLYPRSWIWALNTSTCFGTENRYPYILYLEHPKIAGTLSYHVL